ncbi:hypothetical protein BSKO_07971 [Bryopsis sp. KO-2023]|nr:hypothetical protein BSKO_07971 [Bryopsis sp. KO-2023]
MALRQRVFGCVVVALLATVASAADPPFCDCDATYTPVCGTDDQTYGNACIAKCARVEVAAQGVCQCPETFGTCSCPDEGVYRPVCADGLTWKSRCDARCAGKGCIADGVCPIGNQQGWTPTTGGDAATVQEASKDPVFPDPGSSPRWPYDTALHMSLMLYEAHQTGILDRHRFAWRGDSCFSCKGPSGEDLSKGFTEAGGSNLKMLMPSSFTVTHLAWSVKDFPEGFKKTGDLDNALSYIRWGAEFLISSHSAPNRIVAMFGNSTHDFNYFGPLEHKEMWLNDGWGESCYATPNDPATEAVAEAAAALAATSIVFKDVDSAFSKEALDHAKDLYSMAFRYRRSYQVSPNPCLQIMAKLYPSNGFDDELVWAAGWMYAASGNKKYRKDARTFYDSFVARFGYGWALTTNDKTPALHTLMYQVDPARKAKYHVGAKILYDQYLEQRVPHTPKGLAYPFHWGASRAASNAAALVLAHSKFMREYAQTDSSIDLAYAARLFNYGKHQINYLLGSSGRSWVSGFGSNYPTFMWHKPSYNSHIDANLPGQYMWFGRDNGPWIQTPEFPFSERHPVIVESAMLEFQGSFKPQKFIPYGHLFGAPLFNDGMVNHRKDYSHTEATTEGQGGLVGGSAALAEWYDASSKQNDCGLDLGWGHPNAKPAKRANLC